MVNHHEVTLLVTTYTEIHKQNPKRQVDTYKQGLTDDEVFEKMLNRFSQLIFSSQSSEDVFKGVGKLCLELLDFDDLSIFLVNQKTQMLHQVAIVSRNKQFRYDETGNQYISLPISKGITGKCARTKTSILLEDVRLDDEYIKDTVDCKSELAVPIIYKNEVLGVIDSESNRYGTYTDKNKRIIEGIASLLAIKLNELESMEYLEAKNDQLISLVRNNPNAIAMLDKEGNYMQVSDEWMEQFVSSKHNSIIGLNHFELNPNIPNRWKKLMDKAYQGESQVLRKEGYKRKNGTMDFFKGKVNPWYLKKGEVGGIVIQADTITKVVNDEARLLNSAEELAEARSLGQLFNWEIDIQNGTVKVDTGRLTIPGIENGKKYNLDDFFKFIDTAYHADFNQALDYAISSKEAYSFIHPIKLKNRTFWLDNRLKVVNEDDEIILVKGTAQNITNQVDAQNAYKQKNRELKQLNRELDRFVYQTAHDLRAPLANITGLIGLMRTEENPEKLASYFDLQEKSISKLDNFILKIASYTKNTRLPVTRDKIDFNEIADAALEDHMFIAGYASINKKLTVDTSQVFYSDIERIKIIFNNLIANAIQFKDSQKETHVIEIDVKAEGKYIHICVRDNGMGIPKELKDRVFDMFYRAHKSAVGSGVGLYIVRETVRKLGGSILLQTELGEFTEFNILLPNIKL